MGLPHFKIVIFLHIFGATFTSAEPPVPSYGAPSTPSFTMKRADMVYEKSTVELENPSIIYSNSQSAPGWTPFQNSHLSSYQPLRTVSAPIANFQAATSKIDSYSNLPTLNSQSLFNSLSGLTDYDFTRSATNYYAPAATTTYGAVREPEGSQNSGQEIRFVVHKDGEEDQVKQTLSKEYDTAAHDISFIRGPQFNFQKKQKLFLPPKPKTIVFILLRTPEVNTETEVVPSPHDPKPEVRIVYQRPEGVKTQHYDPQATNSRPSKGY